MNKVDLLKKVKSLKMGLEEIQAALETEGNEITTEVVVDGAVVTDGSSATETTTKVNETMPAITKEAIREVMVAKSRGGKTTEVKDALAKFGVAKLGDVAEENYHALLAALEAL